MSYPGSEGDPSFKCHSCYIEIRAKDDRDFILFCADGSSLYGKAEASKMAKEHIFIQIRDLEKKIDEKKRKKRIYDLLDPDRPTKKKESKGSCFSYINMRGRMMNKKNISRMTMPTPLKNPPIAASSPFPSPLRAWSP